MKNLFTWLLVFAVLPATAQDKLLTIEDALVKNRSTLAPASLRQLQFIHGTEDYVYLGEKNGFTGWIRGSLTKGVYQEAPFLDLKQLNEKLKAAGRDTVASMPAIRFDQEWTITVKGERFGLDINKKTFRVLVPAALSSMQHVDENGKGRIAYVNKHNLFITNGTTTKQLTTDGSADIVYGSSVHREEFGISKGTFWSPAGNLLAFYRMDQSMVTDYPIIDWTQTPAKNVNIKYPMAGDSSHQVTIGVYNTATDKLVYLQTGLPADQYLTNIAWSPDERYVFVAVLNREQNHMKLNQYDANTGAFIKTLFEEKDEKYVEPMNPMMVLRGNASQFIWQSRRDGWNHLYLYSLDGKLLKQLTKGNWEVNGMQGFDGTGQYLLFTGTKESYLRKDVYKLNIATGEIILLTRESGVHNPVISSSGNTMLDVFGNAGTARQVNVINTKTGSSQKVFEAADPLKDYKPTGMRITYFTTKDGTELAGRLCTPPGFDSTKKYPVIVYWYGGPHAQMITAGFNGGAGDYWFRYMAQRGFLVFSLDTRGSSNRGKAFEQAIFRKHGEAQREDMMSAIGLLANLGYADTSRMGLFGWSYGGFMTTDFMLSHPGIFKAAVAGGPVVDWRLYEIMYGERYMDTPGENPEGYAATDLTRKIDRLKGKLLLIHGMQDPVVVQQHSVKLVRAAIDKGVQVDYMIYPGHEHNVTGKDRAHLYKKVTDYLLQYLD